MKKVVIPRPEHKPATKPTAVPKPAPTPVEVKKTEEPEAVKPVEKKIDEPKLKPEASPKPAPKPDEVKKTEEPEAVKPVEKKIEESKLKPEASPKPAEKKPEDEKKAAPAKKSEKPAPGMSPKKSKAKPGMPPKKKKKSPEDIVDKFTPPPMPDEGTEKKTAAKAKDKVMLPSWITIRMEKDEKVHDVEVMSTSSGGVGKAIIAAVLVLAAGAVCFFKAEIGKSLAGSLPEKIAGMPGGDVVALGAAVLIAVIAFVVLLLGGKSSIALVVTSIRSVCVVGKNRLEVKRQDD